jgi:hypothetical protein
VAGTNAVVVKTALLALFKTGLATAGEGGKQVLVHDAYHGRLVEREYVYFGHLVGSQEPLVFRAAGRMPRLEELTVDLHVEVAKPGATTVETDGRVTAIGTVIEEIIAADPTFGATIPGLTAAWVSNFTLTSFYMEDGKAASEGVYQISIQSQLR